MTQWEYSAFFTDEDEIVHVVFERGRPHRQEASYAENLWSECIAILGELGWEAINVNEPFTPVESTTIWFKRVIRPNNDYLTIT